MAILGQHILCPKGFGQCLLKIDVRISHGDFTALTLVTAFDMFFNITAESLPNQM
jgi:hypothetical protein